MNIDYTVNIATELAKSLESLDKKDLEIAKSNLAAKKPDIFPLKINKLEWIIKGLS